MHTLLRLSPKWDLAILTLLLGILFFSTNSIRPLANPDEGRYTEIPREMLENGDWVTPRLNGVLYFEKPPLFYWTQALALKAGGLNEASARFGPALFALLGCLATYLAGKTLFGRETGLASSLILGTSLLYFAMSQLVIIDMAVSVLIASALLIFITTVKLPRGRERHIRCAAFFALLALAVLAKGLIGIVIPVAVIFLWTLVFSQWKRILPFYPLTGLTLFLAISVPWHVLAWQANPEFAWFYFVNEHFLRYLTRGHDRYQPFWFFLAILPVALIPWIGFLPQAIGRFLDGGWKRIKARETEGFLVIWTLFVLIFFSASDSKLIPYILPLFPALALIIGKSVALDIARADFSRLRLGVGTIGTIALLLAIAFPWTAIHKADRVASSALTWSLIASGILAVAAILSFVALRRPFKGDRLSLPLAATAAFYVVLNPLATAFRNDSTKEICNYLQSSGISPGDVYSFLDYHQDIAPYMNSQVNVAACEPEEQLFGRSIETDTANWLDSATFLHQWRSEKPMFAIATSRHTRDFRAKHPEWEGHIVKESNQYLLLANEEAMNQLHPNGYASIDAKSFPQEKFATPESSAQ